MILSPTKRKLNTYTAICVWIRNVVKDPPIQHKKPSEVYSVYNSSRDSHIENRRDPTLLAKLHIIALKLDLNPLCIQGLFKISCRDSRLQNNIFLWEFRNTDFPNLLRLTFKAWWFLLFVVKQSQFSNNRLYW